MKIGAAIAVAVLAPAGAYIAYTNSSASTPLAGDSAKTIALTVTSSNGAHDFTVETARTEEEQQRGLMFRTAIAPNAGMLFAPYPPGGGGPKEASFWMKNTPSPLDIIFIRADGTIATIAENTMPFSEAPIPSGEPVAAVLEINGGRSAELGIAQGDKVTWAGQGK